MTDNFTPSIPSQKYYIKMTEYKTTNLLHFVNESLPVTFNDFKHHVVLNVLDEVQHPLPQGKRSSVGARGRQREALGHLVADPHPENIVL